MYELQPNTLWTPIRLWLSESWHVVPFFIIFFYFSYYQTQIGLPCVGDVNAGRDHLAFLLQQGHRAGVGVPAGSPAVSHHALLLRHLWAVAEGFHLMAVEGSVAGDLPVTGRGAEDSWLAVANHF